MKFPLNPFTQKTLLKKKTTTTTILSDLEFCEVCYACGEFTDLAYLYSSIMMVKIGLVRFECVSIIKRE